MKTDEELAITKQEESESHRKKEKQNRDDNKLKKKRSHFDRSTPSKLEHKLTKEVASDPMEDSIEQTHFNVTNKSSESDNCRRKLVFDSPDLQLSVTGSQVLNNPNIEKGKLNLLESDSDAYNKTKISTEKDKEFLQE